MCRMPTHNVGASNMERLKRRSTLTGIGNVLFAAGLILLFVCLFNDASRTGFNPRLAVALCLLAATAVCWIAAALWAQETEETPQGPQAA
jgi:hypothetical protein